MPNSPSGWGSSPLSNSAMSVESIPQTATCAQCDGERDPLDSVEGSYCSRECYLRHKGGKVLDSIRRDHTICPTCFARTKETQRPSDDYLRRADVSTLVRQSFIGFQYRTPQAEHVETTVSEGKHSLSDTVVTAIGCQCGTGPGPDPDATLERVEGAAVVLNLLRELRRRYARGELDQEPSKDRLFAALEREGREWDYAVGAALWGDG